MGRTTALDYEKARGLVDRITTALQTIQTVNRTANNAWGVAEGKCSKLQWLTDIRGICAGVDGKCTETLEATDMMLTGLKQYDEQFADFSSTRININ